MVNEFIFFEILLYITPILSVFLIRKYFKDHLRHFENFPITEAMILTPLWLTLIHLFSLLIFSYSLIFFIIAMTALAVGIHLYFHIRRVRVFSLKRYFYLASKIVFVFLTSFLIALIILRIYTYFG